MHGPFVASSSRTRTSKSKPAGSCAPNRKQAVDQNRESVSHHSHPDGVGNQFMCKPGQRAAENPEQRALRKKAEEKKGPGRLQQPLAHEQAILMFAHRTH